LCNRVYITLYSPVDILLLTALKYLTSKKRGPVAGGRLITAEQIITETSFRLYQISESGRGLGQRVAWHTVIRCPWRYLKRENVFNSSLAKPKQKSEAILKI
jgi:hypothetical protein